MPMLWRVKLLGGLRAEGGGRAVTHFRTQNAGLLLAYLAYHGERAHPREQLIELLWPEADPDAGRAHFRKALFLVRRELEPPGTPAGAVLVADRTFVRLTPAAVTTDTTEFELALQAAAAAGSAQERGQALARAVEL